MSEWKRFKLLEIAEITTGFPFKGNKYSSSGVRVVRGENVTIGDLRWDTIKCWDEQFDQFDKYSLKNGDIVIGMDGSRVGKNRAQIRKADLPLLLAQRVACVRAKKGFSQDLIAYLIKSNSFERYVEMVHTGTSIPHISQKQIEEFTITIPNGLKTQTAIAEILSSLDDKIELNNKINQELENLAQTLFKQWFIDFEFPNENGELYKSSGGEMVESELGEIPKGWEVGTLSEILDVKGGTTPSTKEAKYWNGSINWTSPRDLSNLKFPLLIDTEKKITELGLSKISSGLLPKGTLLLSSRAPIGYLAITNIETAINQGYIAINCKGGYSNTYILYWLKANMNLVVERANGSTFLEISKSNFKQINCVIPALNALNAFTSQAHILFDKLRNNILENQQLTDLRDTLLPKLISGELEVSQTQTNS